MVPVEFWLSWRAVGVTTFFSSGFKQKCVDKQFVQGFPRSQSICHSLSRASLGNGRSDSGDLC